MKTCCNEDVKKSKVSNADGSATYTIWCEKCGRTGSGKTVQESERSFDDWGQSSPVEQSRTAQNKIAPNKPASNGQDDTPVNPDNLPAYIASHATDLATIAAPFMRADKPAFALMVKKNTRYVMAQDSKQWRDVWATREGQESVVAALEEAFMLGATLPDMGCIVPYGGIVEFIPGVEAYSFAATTGKASPFIDLNIEPIYKNDIVDVSRTAGHFNVDFKKIGVPRGEIIAIAVYGTLRSTGKTIGEIYEAARLLEKATTHSASYRAYRADLAAFESAKVAGKLKTEDGREYVEKAIPKRDGGTWNKKIFREDITNPYDGADRPEMLRKVAGKSFLTPYMRVRNSTAAMDELATDDAATSTSMDAADELDAVLDEALRAVPCD
jgi:hypothetical protein